MTTPYLKGAANTHVAFLHKHSTPNPQECKLRLKHHTCYVLHYFKLPPLLADILADIFLNMFPTTWPKHSLWTSFKHSNIIWHSWHIFDHSLWHILSDLLANISPDILSDLSCDILQLLLWPLFLQLLPILSITGAVRYATLNSHNRGWGPVCHTELAESQLRSGTQHWTHEITVGVRHATLNTQDRGWGPVRHTALTGSRLKSSTPHWTHRIAVEVRHATLNTQNRDRTRRRKTTRRRRRRTRTRRRRDWHKI